jgi:ABC-type branched-subunit amino acid transport system substrate-binding protein
MIEEKEGRGVIVSQVMPFPFSTTTPISREYLEAVRKAGGDAQPNYSSMEGYLAAKVFAEALRRAGRSPSRDALINALESIQDASFVSVRRIRLDDGERLYEASATGGFQRWGNNSSIRLAGWVGSRSRTSRRYAYGS